MKKLILLISMCFALCGCPGDSATGGSNRNESSIATNVEVPTKTKSPEEQKIDDLKKKLDESDRKAAEAGAKSDIIARLSAEKDSLGIRTQLAEAYSEQWKKNADSYKSQEKEKEQELKDAKLDAWKTKLWWMAGICGLLAIVAGGVAWGFPLIRPIATKASIILGAIAALMLFVAESLATVAWLLGFVPYVLAFGGLVALVFVALAVRHWWKDHNGLSQTIQGIEPIKEEFEDFKDHMLKYVDGSLVDHVKTYRNKLFTTVSTDVKKVVTPVVEDVKKVEDTVTPLVAASVANMVVAAGAAVQAAETNATFTSVENSIKDSTK